MSRREPFSKPKSRLQGNHQARGNSRIMIYLVLLVVVVIIMVSIGKFTKGPAKDIKIEGNKIVNTSQNTDFTKEGELELFNQDDSLIVKIDIEIADDDDQTSRGLMYRRTLSENHGMLFIFPHVEEKSFWMKNTYIALDLIFLDADKKIVHIHEAAQPKSEESIPSIEPAKYVLEVNAGYSAQHFLKVGDRMDFLRTY